MCREDPEFDPPPENDTTEAGGNESDFPADNDGFDEPPGNDYMEKSLDDDDVNRR